MRLLLYTDNHFCEKSSIITKIGDKYSVRLENQIKSVNWTEELAVKNNCDAIICLGDFFDKQFLTDQELTALNDIKFNTTLPHIFIVGNHESEEIDLKYSSTQCLSSSNMFIVNEACKKQIGNVELCFLPYVTERNIRPLSEIFGNKSLSKRIILSHNDIAGIQMGAILSKTGFQIADIETNCALFLNGHLHNGSKITDKVINLGNLTGKDFGENAFKYKHCAFVLDTETLALTAIENPYAFNFYQLTINTTADIENLDNLKDNMVLKLNCKNALALQLNEKLFSLGNRVAGYKIISIQSVENFEDAKLDIADLTTDYLAELCTCCKAKLENTPVLDYELSQICK